MSTLLNFDGLEQTRLPARPVHLAIGMFDGVHLGHRSVIGSAIDAARLDGGLAGVLTFWPHPSVLFRPEAPARLLLSQDAKRGQLASMGLDFLIEQKFSPEFARTSAAEFIQLLRRCLPSLAAVYVGENFRFGRGREGNVGTLVEEGRRTGLDVCIAPPVNHGGSPISSSRIRVLLKEGPIEEVNLLLGRPYSSKGIVQPGRRLGRTIGFPTLNLAWEPELKPRYGVYAVTVTAGNASPMRGVANYGLRPTVEQATCPLLEVHLLDPTALTYGDEITVQWLHFLRPETKFRGVEELRAQIEQDRNSAIKFFAESANGGKPNNA